MTPMGYAHPQFAASFSEFGEPRRLNQSGGWLLERRIGDSERRDAMGLYPLFCCEDWDALEQDLGEVGDDCVSVILTTDPFGGYDEASLKRCFDVVRPYKDHYFADLDEPLENFASKSYRAQARKALRSVEAEIVDEPARYLDEWLELWSVLCEKHDIRGLRAFSRESFEKQLRTPGLVMCRVTHEGKPVGMDLCYQQGEVVQGHLVAMSPEAYRMGVSHAIRWTLLNHFVGKARFVNLGGVPDTDEGKRSGLAKFKLGWTNRTRKSYLCGRVFDPETYEALSRDKEGAAFFPKYRAGETL